MLPYQSLVPIDRSLEIPVYQQISSAFIQHIQSGLIAPSAKLPSSRVLSKLLKVHRKTVLQAINELEGQGWVEVLPHKGVYVVYNLPKRQLHELFTGPIPIHTKPHYEITVPEFFSPPKFSSLKYEFSDGTPDPRLAPINELASIYGRLLRAEGSKEYLMYGDARGHIKARMALADYFRADRGLNISADNIMITRGSQMAIYMAAKILIRTGDQVAVGETNYPSADICFQSLGASLVPIPIDHRGMDVDLLEQKLLGGLNIRCLYITSHHHHPTTVSLSPERRLRLLDLAKIYDFAIIEDDYSYDFHYEHSPLLPIASADRLGSVVYIGSFSKSTAPAFRIGYLVAPVQVIESAVMNRRFMDRQGDLILDLTLAELLNKGIIHRYKKKAIKAYQKRLDLFCELFKKHELSQHADYERPEGGLAVWVRWKPHINLVTLSEHCESKELSLSNGLGYNPPGQLLNSNRMGFAFLNESEMTRAFQILTQAIEEIV